MDATSEAVEAKQAGVAEFVERGPHQDRRALAVGRRNRRDDAGWYLPVRGGVEGRNHARAGETEAVHAISTRPVVATTRVRARPG